MKKKQINWIILRRPWAVLRWATALWGCALALALAVILGERAALGYVAHKAAVGNGLALAALLGLAEAAMALFRAGWMVPEKAGFRCRIPWTGTRKAVPWNSVDFLGLVPGAVAGIPCPVAILIVSREEKATVLEYRKAALSRLLDCAPRLRLAALADSARVAAICRELDAAKIGWLPLARVRRADGTQELVLRSAAREAAPAAAAPRTANPADERITTPRLLLRPFVPADAQAMLALLGNEEIAAGLGFPPLGTMEEARTYLKDRFLGKTHQWALCLRESGRMVGFVGIDPGEAADMLFALARDQWNKGLMTEAVRAVLARLKAEGALFVTAVQDAADPAAGRVLRKAGMKYAYSFRSAEGPAVFRLYQVNLDGDRTRMYQGYWENAPEPFVENELDEEEART